VFSELASFSLACMQGYWLVYKADFLSQVIDTPARGDAILDLKVTNERELISDVKTAGSLGCSDHALVEFTVLRDMERQRVYSGP